MQKLFCLNGNYSTTRLISTDKPEFVEKTGESFKTVLLLPVGEGRKGVGGLRTKNYFKSNDTNIPLVTIITVVFNGEKHLEETILSVINQPYDNIEYIVIDGGSTDGTLDIIRKYDEQIDYWVSEADKGIYDAMNKGLRCSLGEIIGIINADDWYELSAITQVVKAFNGLFNRVVHGNMDVYQDNTVYYKSNLFRTINKICKGMIINHPTAFVGKCIYKKHGLFCLKYRIASDWDFMLRLWKAQVEFKYITSTIANFRLGGASYNINLDTLLEKHEIRKCNNLYNIIDKYYIVDCIRSLVFGKYLSKISIFRQKFSSKL